ncbi:MAG: DUF3574 domain-containing protein [Ruminiclostridium sp.]|nr:DUF3574 domain-containing protein [Ruminiclostridium sp.]
MKKKIISVILAALMIGTAASCANSKPAETAAAAPVPAETAPSILGQESEKGDKFTLYLGLNDKDTYEQKYSLEDSYEKANRIVAKHAGGFTQMSAKGGWTDESEAMFYENTIVYIVFDISDENLSAMLDELIKEFNQSTVLVERESKQHIYYHGK